MQAARRRRASKSAGNTFRSRHFHFSPPSRGSWPRWAGRGPDESATGKVEGNRLAQRCRREFRLKAVALDSDLVPMDARPALMANDVADLLREAIESFLARAWLRQRRSRASPFRTLVYSPGRQGTSTASQGHPRLRSVETRV